MMKRYICFSTAAVLLTGAVWIGCNTDHPPLAPGENQNTQALAKNVSSPPALEVEPLFRVQTGRKAERLTVFVFYERDAKGGKPGGGSTQCSDPNTNQLFKELSPRWVASGISVAYQPLFEPDAVIGQAFGAIDRAFSAWETAVNNSGLINFAQDSGAPLPPARDNSNVVGWRQLVGRDARKILAATWIWDDGSGTILETDVVYNTSQTWSVNPAITPGSTSCGTNFDVQAIGTHEIGHVLGLDHVVDDGNALNGNEGDATMAPTAAKGELKKQTLTSGDVTGVQTVAPALLASGS